MSRVHFKPDLPAPESFNREFKLWTQQWKSSSILPQKSVKHLNKFEKFIGYNASYHYISNELTERRRYGMHRVILVPAHNV